MQPRKIRFLGSAAVQLRCGKGLGSGIRLKERLYNLIAYIWSNEKMSQSWKNANIVPIFKRGNMKVCEKYRKTHFFLQLERL